MFSAFAMSASGAVWRRRGLALLIVAAVGTGAPLAAAGPFKSPHAVFPDVVVPGFGDSLLTKEGVPHVSRALAAALAVTLGPFGAHRLYLGTKPKVPLLYGITFGGFGVLVLIDLGHILFTPDLSRYQNSRQVLMWAKPQERKEVTPP